MCIVNDKSYYCNFLLLTSCLHSLLLSNKEYSTKIQIILLDILYEIFNQF